MSQKHLPAITDPCFVHEAFNIQSLIDEIRVDTLCQQLLQVFCAELVANGLPPAEAGRMALSADYFLREFVIADRYDNLFSLPPKRIRQFAGNWYIVRNMEPNMAELGQILEGVAQFYRFCLNHERITADHAAEIIAACQERDVYARRIESFWAIKDDGYAVWESGCSLKEG